MGPKKISSKKVFGLKNIFGPKKIFGKKDFGQKIQKNCGQKTFLIQENLGPTNFEFK